MKKLVLILVLLTMALPALAANDDISDRGALGTATTSDAILGVDASATAGDRLKRILFSGTATEFLTGTGTWGTEADPVFTAHDAYGITSTNITNWGTAYTHSSSTANPHSVTATQVGLGSVDNTADTAKPVSTAQQTALDGKVDGTITIVHQDLEPASCTVGDLWIDTNGTEGERLYNCESTNVWIKQVGGGGGSVSDTAYGAGWDGVTTEGASKNALYYYLVQFDADADGDYSDEAWFPSTSGAPTNASYLTTTAEAALSNETVVTSFALTVLDDADAATARTTLGAYGSGDNISVGTISGTTISAGGTGFEVDLDGDVTGKSFTTPDTDGSNRIQLFNNTVITETASTNELYFEAHVFKVNENGTEKTVLDSSDIDAAGGVQAYDADLTTYGGITPSANVQSLLGAATYAAMRTLLDLEAGTDFHAYDADLADLADDGSLTGSKVGTGISASNVTTGTLPVAQLPSAATQEIASGTSALGTSAIADGACATVVTTSATNVATTDVINWGFNGDPTSTTGYNPSSGVLTIFAYPTANNVNFRVCNLSGSSITPASVTLNWRVDR